MTWVIFVEDPGDIPISETSDTIVSRWPACGGVLVMMVWFLVDGPSACCSDTLLSLAEDDGTNRQIVQVIKGGYGCKLIPCEIAI